MKFKKKRNNLKCKLKLILINLLKNFYIFLILITELTEIFEKILKEIWINL